MASSCSSSEHRGQLALLIAVDNLENETIKVKLGGTKNSYQEVRRLHPLSAKNASRSGCVEDFKMWM